MSRFDTGQARRYWELHAERRARVDFTADPEGLANVCDPGAPPWLNRYYAEGQSTVFRELLERVGTPASGATALDVGCGAGRWCRVLAARGYQVTGIDLQQELIDRNRRALPHVAFHRCAIQEFDPEVRFEMVTSVTVLQHIPHEEQPQVVRKLRTLLRDGGHALLLENVADDAPHVFSRSVDGWRRLFESSRFSIVAERPYDYSPSLRLLGALTRRLRGARSEAATPETYLVPAADGPPRRRLASAVLRAAQRGAVAVDRVIEPRLVARAAPLPSVHHGYLLRASVSSTASASRGAARGW